MPVCLVAFVGGNCATSTPGTLLNKKYDKNDKAQQWTIERDGDNKLAFKSEVDGQYIRATAGQAYGNITTGAKQWWVAERGAAPGSFWFKCTDFPDAYIANASASMANGNKIYCWPKQQGWAHALQWYLQDSVSGDGISAASPGSQSAEETAAKTQEQEKALAEREAAIKLREAELAKRETQTQHGKAPSTASEEQFAKMKNDLQQREKEVRDLEARLKAAETTSAGENGLTASESQPEKNLRQDDSQKAEVTMENERLRRELVEIKIAFRKSGNSGHQPWIPTAVQPPQRKLPPVVRPARRLPNGFDRALIERATGPAPEVVDVKI